MLFRVEDREARAKESQALRKEGYKGPTVVMQRMNNNDRVILPTPAPLLGALPPSLSDDDVALGSKSLQSKRRILSQICVRHGAKVIDDASLLLSMKDAQSSPAGHGATHP